MSLRTYPKYKDSGSPWLGHVPEQWDICPLLSVAHERSESNVGMLKNNLLSLSYGRIVRKDIGSNDGLLPESFETYQIVQPGDIVLRLTDLQNDKRSLRSAIVEEEGIITFAYLALQPRRIEPRFLAYLLRAYDLTKVFYSMGGGLRQSMKFADLKRMPVVLPSNEEQTIIVGFLDRETAKIDSLIAKQQRLIVLLAEKRQAIISRAVTSGLTPNVRMKDSGVAWLGEIPAEWRVVSLKHLVSTPITDGPHETPNFPDQGVPFVSAEAVSGGFINFEKIRGYISVEDHLRYSTKYKPQLNDIYMIKSGATTGVTAIVESDKEFNIWSPLAAIRCDKKKADPFFVLAAMRSRNFQEGVALNWSFGTQQNIGMGVLGNLPIPLPPLPEQHEISAFLGRESPRLDELSVEAERVISLLKERRSALIAAAVTGQIDVREFDVTQTRKFALAA